MKPSASQRPDDATLVAWLDGELSATDSADVTRHVAADGDLAERVRLLRSARAELAWAIGDKENAPPPAPIQRAVVARPRFGLWLLAAAALTIVFTIGFWQPVDQQEAAAENDWLAVELTTPRAGWDLFSGIRFAIEGQAKTTTPIVVVSRRKGETDEQMVARAIAEQGNSSFVPITIDAEILAGNRRMLGRVARVAGTFSQQASRLAIELIDVRVQYDGIAPLLTVRLDEQGASEDFRWGFGRGVTPEATGSFGFIPEQVGEYRLRLSLRALPIGEGQVPAFDEPLDVAVGFAVRGLVGKWSEPVDGMRARIVASRARSTAGKPLALALQLRNDSDRPREFNITGSTIAKIPQPFHFDLIVDGQQCRQRNRLGVITAARWGSLPQPVRTIRSMIVLADYWLVDGERPSKLTGSHQLGVRFHFEPSLWNNADRALWMGKIDTPPVTVEFGAKR